MTCDELYGRLTELSEGTLREDLCREVEAHLASCGDCRHLRQDLEDLARLCRQAAVATVMPDDVRHRIEVVLADGGEAAAPPPAGTRRA